MTGNAVICRAKKLRRSANYSEQKVWAELRKLRRHGFPVRRQHPIGPYVVDFAITRAKLVIEIDGGIHRLEEVASRDEMREKYLIGQGWRVLRIDAGEALSEDFLMRQVSEALGF